MIVRVNVVLNYTLLLTVTDFSTTCAPVIFRVKVTCITSVDSLYAYVANLSTFGSSVWFGE